MIKKFFYCILILIFFSCDSNKKPCAFYNSGQMPYNPEKAGAVIVEKYDITDGVKFGDKEGEITSGYDLIANGNFLFIRAEDKIIIFDKETMLIKGEVQLIFEESVFSSPLYKYWLQGLVITDEYALLQCRAFLDNSSLLLSVFSINMETGQNDIIDIENKFSSNLKSLDWPAMGFDKINNLLWFWVFDNQSSISDLYFYSYDKNNRIFILEKTIEDFINRKYIDDLGGRLTFDIFINGSDLWVFNRGDTLLLYDENYNTWYWESKISRRSINNPYVILHEINLEYLGLDFTYLRKNRFSESILFDEPYIWIMVVIDRKIQLLKLIPSG